MTDTSDPTKAPGFVGYNADGIFVHYCWCGKWAPYGFGVKLAAGRFGKWFCREHRPTEGGAAQ